MLRKNKESPQIDKTVAKAVNFEVSVSELARRSEKRAWIVAMFALVVGLAMTGVVVYMQPLQKTIPYVVVVDPYSGNSTTSVLTPDIYQRIPKLGPDEALGRANIAQYVIARESYDYAFWELRDWEQTIVMSAPDIAREYQDFQNPNKNPTAPSKEYGRDRAIRVRILNILPAERTSGTSERPGGSADVRIQRTLYDKKSGTTRPLDNRIIRVEYVWNSDLALDNQRRHLNPLGFQVINYRVEGDYDTRAATVVPPSADGYTGGAAAVQPGAAFPQGQQGFPQQFPGAVPTDPSLQGVPGQPGQFPAQQVPGQPGQFPAQPGQVPPQPGQFPPQQVPGQPGQFPQQGAPAQPPPQQTAPAPGTVPNQVNGASH